MKSSPGWSSCIAQSENSQLPRSNFSAPLSSPSPPGLMLGHASPISAQAPSASSPPLLPGHLHMLFALLAILSLLKYCQGFRFLATRLSVPMFLSQRCLFLTFRGSITLSTPLPYHFQSYTFSPLFLCVYLVLFIAERVFSFTKIYFVRAATLSAFFIPYPQHSQHLASCTITSYRGNQRKG